MNRKIIYIIVFILTIALVVTDHYIKLSKSESQETPNVIEEELDNSLSVEVAKANLVIKNTQDEKEELVYTYKIEIEDVSGAQLAFYKGKEIYVIFTANGVAEITIDSNETITLTNINQGSKYTIDQITDVSDKYTTKVNNIEDTSIEGEIVEENIIEFTNKAIKNELPEESKNPFTSDNHYLKVIVFIYAAIIIIVALKFRIKRFG